MTAKTDAVAWDDAGATALLPLARGATLFEERPFVLAAARADGFGAAAKWRATVRAATKRRGAFEMHGAVFGADRSDAAGRDVDIPRAAEGSGTAQATVVLKQRAKASSAAAIALAALERVPVTPPRADDACGVCGGPPRGAKPVRCSKCRTAAFCGQQCFKKAWAAGHKNDCGPWSPIRAREARARAVVDDYAKRKTRSFKDPAASFGAAYARPGVTRVGPGSVTVFETTARRRRENDRIREGAAPTPRRRTIEDGRAQHVGPDLRHRRRENDRKTVLRRGGDAATTRR